MKTVGDTVGEKSQEKETMIDSQADLKIVAGPEHAKF
jgi:hypothetical protein